MKYLSICSGIEAATVAWEPLGWSPLAFAEIDKFPSAVLSHRWPNVNNLGDLLNYEQWNDMQPDILVGGTPCQSFSVAGLRKGLADDRGNITLKYIRVAERYRPTWLVWENVPGVLSDRTGAFGSFLGGLAELGYGFAYRVLDAQYYGVPQRRKRVFVVGYLGDWRCAAAVLFERESLSGDPPPIQKAGQNITGTLNARTTGGGGLGTDFELNGGLIAHTLLGAIATGKFVRRLTPIECERLQGFPDDHTRIPWRGKGEGECPDGPRYKAIGNSMAVPVMRWIGERIDRCIPNIPT